MNIKANKPVRNKLLVFQEALITMICELPKHFKNRLLKDAKLKGEITTAALLSQAPAECTG